MAELRTILIDQIYVPERLRAVEEEHALAIAQNIVEHGLINPITVRATPAAKRGNFALIAGAHRLRAFVINDEVEIDAVIVQADKDEAQLIEVAENLFRNELSVVDRAVFVQSYREAWERKHGKIEPGRPGNSANLALLFEEEAESGAFSKHVAERMGLSRRSYFLLNRIAQNLHPDVRSAVRGTAVADNQSLLLKLAKLEPAAQRKTAAAFRSTGDMAKAIAAVSDAQPKPEVSDAERQAVVRVELDRSWEKADTFTRALFMLDKLIEAGHSELAMQVKAALEARK
ncbi:ParB family chromosome partitioning protein [Rhizobium subbaraonis]|uniref:ParB family chromosome partitioning protein n=1 Tax=Rhizobium subbaraonis TaxID=908946 RepID=A0A285UJQ0_9HYPH|nr:ParB N-terminal domain-containing protein [Rhizobium subbaraonis]SOC41628.1 ParB family chromosome partitioning protein [Rhizobium subbaraonis]